MTDTNTRGVLFVCLGNICRSPLAEGIFIHMARERCVLEKYRVDSAGTGHWHAGNPPDPRASQTASRHGVELPSVARQVDPSRDFETFDHILAMDTSNMSNLLHLGAPEDRVRLYRSFDPALSGVPEDRLEVPDPYYGPGDGFQRVYDMLTAATVGFLDHLESERG